MESEIDSLMSKAHYYVNYLADYSEALKYYDKVLEILPDHPDALYMKTRALAILGKHDEALKFLERYTERRKAYPSTWAFRSGFLNLYGLFSEAVNSSDKALEIIGNDNNQLEIKLQALFNKGEALTFQGKLNDAIKCYDTIVKLDPADPKGWQEQGRIQAMLGEYKEALTSLDNALRINPNLTEIFDIRARILTCLGRMQEALLSYDEHIQQLDKLIASSKNSQLLIFSKFFILYEKGTTLQQMKLHEKAIECFDNALDLAPKDSMLWLAKGISFHNLANFNQAIECFDNALDLVSNERENVLMKMVYPSLARETIMALAWDSKANILMIDGRYHESTTYFNNITNLLTNIGHSNSLVIIERMQKNPSDDLDHVKDLLTALANNK